MTSVVCWRRTKSQAAQRTKRRQLKSLLRLAAVGVMINTTTKLCMTVHRGQRLWLCDAAYEALIDPEKRQIYDRHGEEGLKQHDAQGGGGGGPQDIFSQCVPFRYLGSSMQPSRLTACLWQLHKYTETSVVLIPASCPVSLF